MQLGNHRKPTLHFRKKYPARERFALFPLKSTPVNLTFSRIILHIYIEHTLFCIFLRVYVYICMGWNDHPRIIEVWVYRRGMQISLLQSNNSSCLAPLSSLLFECLFATYNRHYVNLYIIFLLLY